MDSILTAKQDLVLRVIRDYFLKNGYAPSLSELQVLLDIATKRGVVNHLIALEKKGYILRTSEPRGIRMLEENEEPVYEYLIGVPILGYANAGTPLVGAEEENLGVLRVDKNILGKKKSLFSLIVKGDSMDREMIGGKAITDGNYLVVDKEAEIFDGDVVVAIVENCATVKRFKKDQDMVVLYPNSSNPIHQPIYLDKNTESMLNGKVIKVLEKPII
ncbi:MAG TPA: transcriptional repressor LexA [Candidatus Dojkabacteria bacterium]|nr:transcriptional repressor LexA [Candidatus Dojkabacteria bacterium]HOR06215.1 transcriptional repressor LexA [Candidatus Dojkabacteria bacterium]